MFAVLAFQNAYSQVILEKIEEDHVVYEDVKKFAKDYFDVVGRGKGTGYKIYKRWEWRNSYRVMEDGRVASKVRRAQILSEEHREEKNVTSNWQLMGPTSWTHGTDGYSPGIGRITALAVNPNNQNLMYVGSPTGGLWKSTNGGNTWTALGDNFNNQNIWAIAFHPTNSNVVLYGNEIGEVWKTTNGGNTFTRVGQPGTNKVITILFHPNNANIIFVAERYGRLYRSSNGGNTWTTEINEGIEDVVYRPGSTSIMYACGNKFWRSSNGGITWSRISNGFRSSTERMKLAVTPNNNNYVYVVQKRGNGFGYLYRSTNRGASFSVRSDYNDGNFIGAQASRDMAMTVQPNNANRVHIGGFDMYVSSNGGSSWTKECDWFYPNTVPGGSSNSTDYSYVHADIEVLTYVGNNMYAGTDGGIYKSTNHGDDFADLSSGLAITPFYRIHSSQTNSSRVVGGTQDNGTMRTRSGLSWYNIRGADGMECAISPSNSNLIYGCIQYGGFWRTTNGGNSSASTSYPPENNTGEWVTPMAIDPNNGNRVYVGYTDLYRNDGAAASGTNWTNCSRNVNWGTNLRGIETCPSNSNVMYVFSTTNVYKSTNIKSSNPTWSTYSGFNGTINDVAADPRNHNRVIVCTSTGKLYLSTNGLSSKSEISTNLPNVPLISCAIDRSVNKGMYVAIDGGVYFKNNKLSNWITFNNNLPKVEIDEIELYYGNNGTKKVRLGTYGRGLWQSQMYDENTGPIACSAPGGRSVDGITKSGARLKWSAASGASNYDVRYRKVNTSSWTYKYNATGTNRTISGLAANTTYQWQVRTSCGSTNSSYASGPNFKTKINCSQIVSSFPYTHNFDGQPLCGNTGTKCITNTQCSLNSGWTNVTSGDNNNWSVDNAKTPSGGTGPNADHTSGNGRYLYTEASGCTGKTMRVTSPCFNLAGKTTATLEFWYHMYGSNMGSLSLQVSTNGGTSWSGNLWSQSGDKGNSWKKATINLNSYVGQTVKLRFTGVTGGAFRSDMAIDDVKVSASSGTKTVQVRVRTRGSNGKARIRVRRMSNANHTGSNSILETKTYTPGTGWVTYTATFSQNITANKLRIYYDNDASNRDVEIDWIKIGNTTFQTEAGDTYSTGTWTSGGGCNGAFKRSAMLHCNGYFHYDTNDNNRSGEAAPGETAEETITALSTANPYPNPFSRSLKIPINEGVEIGAEVQISRWPN
jgi:photosystem II stability/assembly factor-like uncharacterized protein